MEKIFGTSDSPPRSVARLAWDQTMTFRFEMLTIAGLGLATLLVLSTAFATASDARAPQAPIVVSAY